MNIRLNHTLLPIAAACALAACTAARRALDDFVEACRLANCRPQTGYISSLAMTPAADTTTQTTTQNSTQP